MRVFSPLFIFWKLLGLCLGIDIDGGWSKEGELTSTCNATCNGGVWTSYRACTNPRPSGKGLQCLMMDNKTRGMVEQLNRPCNTNPCSESWSDWSDCNKHCGRGRRRRHTLCGSTKENCTGNQLRFEESECNTWNKTTCPNPCILAECPVPGNCINNSTDIDPAYYCVCVMGYILNDEKSACIAPPPPTPTTRATPVLPPEQKKAAVIVTKTASTVLLILVSLVMLLFLVLRIFTPDRIIKMNMELSLILAHVTLLIPESAANQLQCRIISILLHFFFTACFMFMFLEAVNMYSFVAYVVRKKGLLSPAQNILIGYGTSAFIVLISLAFNYDEYGGTYQCWLMMDRKVMLAEVIPIIALTVLTFIIIEAAGEADYSPLDKMNKKELLSAKISQRTSLVILPLLLASWFTGVLSEYEQSLVLYGAFSILNGIIGGCIFVFHPMGNHKVRTIVKRSLRNCCMKLRRK